MRVYLKDNVLSIYIKNEFNIESKLTVGVEFGNKIVTQQNKGANMGQRRTG